MPYRALIWLLILSAMVGCGERERSGAAEGGDYPLVTETQVKRQPAVTTPDGAVVQLPAPPSDYEVAASPTCERVIATFHDSSTPTKRPIVVPPRPGLRATAITARDVELAWSFNSLPSDCLPTQLLVSVVASGEVGATPTTDLIEVDGESGTTRITYPAFLPPPDVAMASAYTREGHRGRLAKVLIAR